MNMLEVLVTTYDARGEVVTRGTAWGRHMLDRAIQRAISAAVMQQAFSALPTTRSPSIVRMTIDVAFPRPAAEVSWPRAAIAALIAHPRSQN